MLVILWMWADELKCIPLNILEPYNHDSYFVDFINRKNVNGNVHIQNVPENVLNYVIEVHVMSLACAS